MSIAMLLSAKPPPAVLERHAGGTEQRLALLLVLPVEKMKPSSYGELKNLIFKVIFKKEGGM